MRQVPSEYKRDLFRAISTRGDRPRAEITLSGRGKNPELIFIHEGMRIGTITNKQSLVALGKQILKQLEPTALWPKEGDPHAP